MAKRITITVSLCLTRPSLRGAQPRPLFHWRRNLPLVCVRPRKTHVAMRSGTLENSIDILPSALLSDCKRTVWVDWLWQNGLLCYWLQFRKCCLLLFTPPPPPLSFHGRDPAGPQPQPTISLIALLRKTHLSKVTGPEVRGKGGGVHFPLTHIPFRYYFAFSFKKGDIGDIQAPLHSNHKKHMFLARVSHQLIINLNHHSFIMNGKYCCTSHNYITDL